jgi:hypothetical protein
MHANGAIEAKMRKDCTGRLQSRLSLILIKLHVFNLAYHNQRRLALHTALYLFMFFSTYGPAFAVEHQEQIMDVQCI